MNEVDKLYKLAGVEKAKDYYCPNCGTKLEGCFDEHEDYVCPNESCDYVLCYDDLDFQECLEHLSYREGYPLFTAEKQLELIKWLSDVSSYFSVHYDRYKGMYNVQTCDGGLYVTNNLSEAIASRVNIIWNDLSEKQRKQIREILK